MKDPAKMDTFNGEYFERRKHPIGRLIFWIKSKFIQEVPRAMAQCEFGCRKLECTEAEWASCRNRIEASRH